MKKLSTLQTLLLGTLGGLSCLGSVVGVAHAQSNVPKPSIVIAFAKSYNHIETAKLYGGYLEHLSGCAQIDLVNLRGQNVLKRYDLLDLMSDTELLESFKADQLHMAMINTGAVVTAEDTKVASAIATLGKASTGKLATYNVRLITRIDSGLMKPTDLVGKKIAHTTPTSNSGNLAPRAYFPELGLQPDINYTVVYSQGHERSISGVLHGFYDAAAVASDQFQRMVAKGEIRESSFRVLWQSEFFPPAALVLNQRIPAAIQERVRSCTYRYKFPTSIVKLFEGNDRFLPINYEKDYAPVRYVLSRSGKK